MSHTTTINSVTITDIAALRAAAEELTRRGMSVSLEENAKPRAFYKDQEGLGMAPYVLRLHEAEYDVGFYPKQGEDGYEARTDFYGGSVSQVLGVEPKKGDNPDQARLGKLYQAYAVEAAINEASRRGYNPQKVELDNGTVQLRIDVA